MNQYYALHSDETTEPPTEWNIQPSAVHFKSQISPPKTSPVVLAIMGILNHHAIDNGDAKVYNSEYPLEYTSDSVSDPYKNSIK